MPNSARSHEDNRKVVCFLCFQKCDRQVTTFIIENVEAILDKPIDFSDSRVPKGICENCKVKLRKKDTGQTVISPPVFNYKSILVRPVTREQNYNCLICKVGRLKLNEIHPLSTVPNPSSSKTCRSSECLALVGRDLPHECNQATFRKSKEVNPCNKRPNIGRTDYIISHFFKRCITWNNHSCTT